MVARVFSMPAAASEAVRQAEPALSDAYCKGGRNHNLQEPRTRIPTQVFPHSVAKFDRRYEISRAAVIATVLAP